MTQVRVNEQLRNGATIWQLILGIVSTVVVVAGFVFSIRADVNLVSKDVGRHDKEIDFIRAEFRRFDDKYEAGQKEILNAIHELKLNIQNKIDKPK